MERWFEEEYLLRQAKYRSNIDPNDQGDLPGSSNERDVRHKYTRKMGTQKYPRRSCYHRIECTITTFLVAFMWRRPLNSAALATTTHRKSKRMSDGTDTQVRAQMINKCRIKIVQRELYNVRDQGRDRKNRKRTR